MRKTEKLRRVDCWVYFGRIYEQGRKREKALPFHLLSLLLHFLCKAEVSKAVTQVVPQRIPLR
jgi:hypothetical protein